MSSVSEIRNALLCAASLVRRGWCRGSLARDGKGRVTTVDSPKAVKFCPAGAIQKACGGKPELGCDVRRILCEHLGMPTHVWNDGYVKNGRECAQVLDEVANRIPLPTLH